MSKLENMINTRLIELARFEKIEQIEKELIKFGFIYNKDDKELKCPENVLHFYFDIKLKTNFIEIRRNYKENPDNFFYNDTLVTLDYEESVVEIVKQIIFLLEQIINSTTMLCA